MRAGIPDPGSRPALAALTGLVLVVAGIASPVHASSQDDAGTAGDAGDSFEDATLIDPPVPYRYEAKLDPPNGDTDDFYRFQLEEGSDLVVDLYMPDGFNGTLALRSPSGQLLDTAVQRSTSTTASGNVTVRGSPTSVPTGTVWTRVAHANATASGEYRLHVHTEDPTDVPYELCYRPCEGPQDDTLWIDDPQAYPTDLRVLLVPPQHGDLGDPNGPSARDYTVAGIQGIHAWETAIDAFVEAYPEFDHLAEIDIEIDVWDGHAPRTVGYDSVVVFETYLGPRGGVGTVGGQEPLVQGPLSDKVRDDPGLAIVSLVSGDSAAGQVVPDFLEMNEVREVAAHEFGHVLGLGHTLKWSSEHGPDMMRGGVVEAYGNADPLGDGGERTDWRCISNLDLYALAQLYDWIPSGEYQEVDGFREYIDSPLEDDVYCQLPEAPPLTAPIPGPPPSTVLDTLERG